MMVAQLMLALIIVPVGRGVMNDGPRPTRCDNVHPDARESAGRHQPECQHGKYDHRQAGVVGRLTAPGSALLAIGRVSARRRLDRVRVGVGLDSNGLLRVDRRKRGSGIGPRCGSSRHRSRRLGASLRRGACLRSRYLWKCRGGISFRRALPDKFVSCSADNRRRLWGDGQNFDVWRGWSTVARSY